MGFLSSPSILMKFAPGPLIDQLAVLVKFKETWTSSLSSDGEHSLKATKLSFGSSFFLKHETTFSWGYPAPPAKAPLEKAPTHSCILERHLSLGSAVWPQNLSPISSPGGRGAVRWLTGNFRCNKKLVWGNVVPALVKVLGGSERGKGKLWGAGGGKWCPFPLVTGGWLGQHQAAAAASRAPGKGETIKLPPVSQAPQLSDVNNSSRRLQARSRQLIVFIKFMFLAFSFFF